ncbi:MAG: cyanophycin synthetase [Dehalococcoidia bacterium]
MPFASYRTAVSYLVDDLWHGARPTRPGRPLQERIRLLLNGLGDPQNAFPVVHITGTTGKGSTAAMTAAILEAAGHRVGLYTSPFLQSFIERIALNGRLISPQEFANGVEKLKPLIREMDLALQAGEGWGRPGILEVIFAIGLDHFRREQIDVAVIEVGLGGRTDCTNVFDPSAVAVLTNVQLDHTDVLGDTPAAIAAEKAAIIKPGSRAVTGASGEALDVVRAHCQRLGVPLWTLNEEILLQPGAECSALVDTPARGPLAVHPRMGGAHQKLNAALAVAAVDALGSALPKFAVNDEAVTAGIGSAQLPGRFEIVQENPTVVLDGAHNPAAAEVLSEALLAQWPGRRLVLLLGILADKDRASIIRSLVPLATHVVLTVPPFAERAGDPREMLEEARSVAPAGSGVELIEAPEEALLRALALAGADDVVCATGSIYLIGRLRGHWFPEDRILAERRVSFAAPTHS